MNQILKLGHSAYVSTRLFFEKYIYNFSNNLDIHQVYPNIYVSNYSTSTNFELLKELGITHVITALTIYDPPFPQNFQYTWINIEDLPTEHIDSYFFDVNHLIEDIIKHNGKILIHCMAGISRSVTLTCAYILFDIITKGKTITTNPDDLIRLKYWNAVGAILEGWKNKNQPLNDDNLNLIANAMVNTCIECFKSYRNVGNPNHGFRDCLINFVKTQLNTSP